MPAPSGPFRSLAGLSATLALLTTTTLPPSAALASSARDHISVSINVVESCRISASPSGIRSSFAEVSLDLTLACSKGVGASVFLSRPGEDSGSTKNNAKPLGSRGSNRPTSQHFRASDSSEMTFKVYSQLGSAQAGSHDDHADTIVATIVF